jgi:outer membrane protein OmpA-like peptidoglycan-associated protein
MTSVIVAAVFASKLALAVKLPGAIKDIGKDAGTAVADKANQEALDAVTKKLKNVQNENGPIIFKKGKAAVDPKCDKTMQRIADISAEYPGFHVQVDGHTDNAGKASANKKLSQQRAEAVVTYLVKIKKVDAKRLSAKGFGDTQPIADNKTEEGRTKNRRVDFTATKL